MEVAVPPYQNDPATAAQAVGELYLYVRQLSARITEIADQANRLDDRRLELERRNAELETELTAAHRHNDELRARIDEGAEGTADCMCCS